MTLAFGAQGIIANELHFIFRELMGAAPKATGGGDDNADL